MLVNQYLVNTVNTHRDGWGFFYEDFGVFKTKLHPWQTSNLGRAVRDRITDIKPIIAHVRLASLCHNKKEICDKNAHPFESKDFVLAHNGTFEGDIIDEKRFEEKIDSEIFLTMLQEAYDKFPKRKIHKLISDVYDKHFTGKFALLIYFKPTKRFYVARGKTAKLHKIDIFQGKTQKKAKKIGFVINTEKLDLERGFRFSAKISQLDHDKDDIFCSEAEELEENTIYIVNTTYLREVGKIVETKKVETWERNRADRNTHHNRALPNNRGVTYNPVPVVRKEVAFLMELSDEFKLSAEEIDTLFLEITGYSMICAGKDQFQNFQEVLEPILESFSDHKGSLWVKLCSSVGGPMYAYQKFDLQFPYFLNSAKILNENWIEVKTTLQDFEEVQEKDA
jgi:predicted glutamine amidotransferase